MAAGEVGEAVSFPSVSGQALAQVLPQGAAQPLPFAMVLVWEGPLP